MSDLSLVNISTITVNDLLSHFWMDDIVLNEVAKYRIT